MMGSASRRSLYTGVTASLFKRVWEHKNNLGGYFTTKYKCHRLVYYESFTDVTIAIEREKEIKGWRREKKNRLVESMKMRPFPPVQPAGSTVPKLPLGGVAVLAKFRFVRLGRYWYACAEKETSDSVNAVEIV